MKHVYEGPKVLLISLVPQFRAAIHNGLLNEKVLQDEAYKPTHIIDIYKMRRGRYKNVRIWINLDLGTGRRNDLFMTTADNHIFKCYFDSTSYLIVNCNFSFTM